jgi:hypothetical protein
VGGVSSVPFLAGNLVRQRRLSARGISDVIADHLSPIFRHRIKNTNIIKRISGNKREYLTLLLKSPFIAII